MSDPAAVRPFVPTRSADPPPGTRILELPARTPVQIVRSLEEGLSTDVVRRLARHLDAPVKDVLDLAGIKSSTYHARAKRGEPLAPEESERVYRLAKVIEAAEAYFEQPAAARRWLARPKVALQDRTPLDFARTHEGAQYVQDLLGRMAHGVVS